jgi:hypothetical protein
MAAKHRFDLLLSGWIFVWFLLFVFHFTRFSPFFVLVLGVVHNTLYFVNSIRKQTVSDQLFFVVGNFFIKIVPVAYLIFNKRTKVSFQDIVATLVVFAAYVLWLAVNNQMVHLQTLVRLDDGSDA